jgi:hypothetical protein
MVTTIATTSIAIATTIGTMTNHVARLYAVALALTVFFLTWAVVAARPWGAEPVKDPRLAALERREERLRRQSIRVQRMVNRRFASYRVRLAQRRAEIAAANAANARAAAATSVAVAPSGGGGGAGGGGPVSAPAAAPAVVSVPPVTQTASS